MFKDFEDKLEENGTTEGAVFATSVFDVWHSHAKQHAQLKLKGGSKEMIDVTRECLAFFLRVHSSDTFMGSHSQFAQSEFLCRAKTILSLFRTKPKFLSLLTNPVDEVDSGLEFVSWISKVVPKSLEYLYLKTQAPSNVVSNAMRCQTELLLLGMELAAVAPNRFIDNPFPVNWNKVASLICGQSVGIMEKSEAMKMAKVTTGTNDLRVHLVALANDKPGLLLALELGALGDEENVSVLLKRVKMQQYTRRKAEVEDHTMSFSGNLLTAVHEYAMNARNADVSDVGTQYASKVSESVEDTAESMTRLRCMPYEDAVCSIIRECDECAQDSGEGEKNSNCLETLSSLLEVYPDSRKLLDVALCPLTVEGLKTVATWCNNYSEDTWITVLFPFIKEELTKMGLEGVSGRPIEQEVIDFLRDCARIKYLNDGEDAIPTLTFAYELFTLVILAIRHGYIETEGFPRIAGRMLVFHASDSDRAGFRRAGCRAPEEHGGEGRTSTLSTWLRMAFDESVCHKLKTRRAIHEILFSLLGLNSTAWGFDSTVLGEEEIEDALEVLSSPPHNSASLGFWRELCFSYPSFLEKREGRLIKILESIEYEINDMIFKGLVTEYHWFDILQTLLALIGRVSSSNAPLLFELILKALAMAPSQEFVGAPISHGAYSDETLASAIENIELGTQLSVYAVRETIRVGGRKAKVALANHTPWLLLRDPHPLVRAEAMKAMCKCDTLTISHFVEDILFACSPESTHFSEAQDGSEDVEIHALSLALSAARVLGILGTSAIAPCVDRLLWCYDIIVQNQSCSEDEGLIKDSLNLILSTTEPAKLLRYVLQGKGRKNARKLSTLSKRWKRFFQDVESEGYMERESQSKKLGSDSSNVSDFKLSTKGERVLNGSAATVKGIETYTGTVVGYDGISAPLEGKVCDPPRPDEGKVSCADGASASIADTLPTGPVISMSYVDLHLEETTKVEDNQSESWETLLSTRFNELVWNRQPPTIPFTFASTSDEQSLSLPQVPTHNIELTARDRTRLNDEDKVHNGRRTALL